MRKLREKKLDNLSKVIVKVDSNGSRFYPTNHYIHRNLVEEEIISDEMIRKKLHEGVIINIDL